MLLIFFFNIFIFFYSSFKVIALLLSNVQKNSSLFPSSVFLEKNFIKSVKIRSQLNILTYYIQ